MRQVRGYAVAAALLCGPVLAGCGSAAVTGGSIPDSTGTLITGAHTTFVMPQVVGKTLPAAETAIRQAARNAMLVIHSKDVTGKGRVQTTPAQWKVCAQSAPADQPVDQTAYFTLSVTLRAETCPAG